MVELLRHKGDNLYSFIRFIFYSGKLMLSLSSQGQGLLEYSLIIIFVAIVVMLLLVIFGGSVGNLFSNIVANV